MAHHKMPILVRRKLLSEWPEVLNGWLEIAGFLGVAPRTARRRYTKERLPVTVKPRPMALRKDLEAWVRGQRDGHTGRSTQP